MIADGAAFVLVRDVVALKDCIHHSACGRINLQTGLALVVKRLPLAVPHLRALTESADKRWPVAVAR
jgi:hypothetical protein